MADILGRKWQLRELLAVSWDADMAARFPDADHTGCLQLLYHEDGEWRPYDPPICKGWHCNRCGAPTNSYGHHVCPDRPQEAT